MNGKTLAPQATPVAGHGGVLLNVWDHGGHGPLVLLCHCTGTCGRIWDPLAAILRESFHVLALDARGHGESAKPPCAAAYGWSNSGRDILAVLDHFGASGRAMAVGHSGGGAQLVHAEVIAPGRLGRVVLIDPIIAPAGRDNGADMLAAGARRRRALFESRAQARDRLTQKPPMRDWAPEVVDAYIEHALDEDEAGRALLRCPPEIEAWVYEGWDDGDLLGQFGSLAFEPLLLTGAHSNVGPLVALQREQRPAMDFTCVEDAGHFVPQEQPGTVARLARDWLTSR